MDEGRFKAIVIASIAKRAAHICSNPECGAITSGPTEDPSGTLNVGEAAHIFGANVGSARFDPSMPPVDRSDITNAIWLCRICHKLIDDDEIRFPSGLLFEWRREHEARIGEQVGKPGGGARDRFLKRHLGEFAGLSRLSLASISYH